MIVLKNSNKTIREILGVQTYYGNVKYVPIPYKISTTIDSIVIIENLITRTVIGMSTAEYDNPDTMMEYLVNEWFYIPENVAPASLWYTVWNACNSKLRPNRKIGIDSYTIFTTIACNANCPYCYEKDRKITHMTNDVADRLVDFMIENRGGKDVSCHWFGGEPLMNGEVIDRICLRLQNKGVPYASRMISNGVLFNKYTDTQIVDLWKLKHVQITLDGTRENYNRIKNYTGVEHAFDILISNIHRLLNLGVSITIRLNLSLDNGSDLFDLIDYLADTFKHRLSLYIHPLFGDTVNPLTAKESIELHNNYILLDRRARKRKLKGNLSLDRISTVHCMADSGHSVCVTPDGKLTPCEHHSEDEVIGNIWDGITNKDVVDEWKEYVQKPERCFNCWRFPKCNHLRKCPASDECCDAMMKYWIYSETDALESLYERYLNNMEKNAQSEAPYNKEEFLSAVQSEIGKTLDDRNYWQEMFPNVKLGGWCVAFIYAMLKQTYGNVLTTLLWGLVPGSHPFELYNAFQKKGKIFDTPEPGDVVFYKVHSWVAHAGVVVSVSEDGKTFETVEGNVKRNGVSKVCRVIDIPVDNFSVVGFGRPNFQNAKIVIPRKK